MKKRYIAIIIVLLAIVSLSIYSGNNYSPADNEALKYLNVSENVSISKVSNGVFLDGPGNDTAVIF